MKDFSKTVIFSVDSELQARRELQRHFSAIERQAVRDMRNEGFAPPQIRIEELLDMRYIGQAFELTVPAAGDFVRSFHAAHDKRYGYSDAKRAVEIVNIRARAIGLTPKPELSRLRKGHADARAATVGNSRVIFAGKKLATNIYDRARLLAGNRLRGPAIVAEYSATTVIEPGWQGRVDAYGNLILERSR